MKKCKCGGTEFYAQAIRIYSLVVNGDGEVTQDNNFCLDYGVPEGEYICIECDAKYDELDELEQDDE